MENLSLDHTYLIRYGMQDSLNSITVIFITDKAYHILWNDTGNKTWELKTKIERDYSIVEDISDFLIKDLKNFLKEKQNYFDVSTKLVPCPTCGGTGEVQDFSGNCTSTKKICPRCYGSKMIPEIVEIIQR